MIQEVRDNGGNDDGFNFDNTNNDNARKDIVVCSKCNAPAPIAEITRWGFCSMCKSDEMSETNA
jgi:uncharacterized CHY-type Zn-finger protein